MKKHKLFKGMYFDFSTPDKVVKILGHLCNKADRIRLYYGDVKTGQSWGESNDVWGRIGRTTGDMKIPILCHNINSFGGPAILTGCIVGIRTKKYWLYRHEKFVPHENDKFPKQLSDLVHWEPSGDIEIIEK